MNRKNRMIALASAAGLLGAAAAAGSVSPAFAADLWHGRNHTTGVVLVGGETVTGSGTLQIQGVLNGISTTVTCTLASGDLTVTVPTPPPTAPSTGGTITYQATPPAVLSSSDPSSSKYNRCTDTQTGDADDVTASGTWAAGITIPSTATSPYTGPTTGTLSVPAHGITFSTPLISGCSVNGPNSATSFGGSYDGSNGNVVANANQSFTATPTGCTLNRTRLKSATITIDPAIDFVLAP